MMSFLNRARPIRIVALALVPLVVLGQSSDKPTSSTQSKQRRKADSEKKGRHAQEQETKTEAGATSTSPLALPFKRAWQYLTDSASTLPPSVAGAHIYLPLAGGRVLCLDRETGSLLWSSDPGGIISAPIAVAENSVFIATNKVGDDGSEAAALGNRSFEPARAAPEDQGAIQRRRQVPPLDIGDPVAVGAARNELVKVAPDDGR